MEILWLHATQHAINNNLGRGLRHLPHSRITPHTTSTHARSHRRLPCSFGTGASVLHRGKPNIRCDMWSLLSWLSPLESRPRSQKVCLLSSPLVCSCLYSPFLFCCLIYRSHRQAEKKKKAVLSQKLRRSKRGKRVDNVENPTRHKK